MFKFFKNKEDADLGKSGGGVGAPPSQKTSAPKYKNFKEYVEAHFKNLGYALTPEIQKKIEGYMKNPNTIFDSLPIEERLELDELIQERRIKKGGVGKWEVLYNKFILPLVEIARQEKKKASQKSKTEKIDTDKLEKEIKEMKIAVTRIKKSEINESVYEEAKRYYQKAMEIKKKISGQYDEYIDIIDNNIIIPIKKKIDYLMKIEIKLNKIKTPEELEKAISENKKNIKKICDKVEIFEHSGLDIVFLNTFIERLKKSAKRVNYDLSSNEDYKELSEMIIEANRMVG